MQKILIFIFAGLILAFFLVIFFRPISSTNYDFGRHLLLGRIIVETQNVPTTNLLSYVYKDYPFINSHWLSEVVFSLVEKYSNINVLPLFSTLIATIAFSLLVLFVRNKTSIISVLLSSMLYIYILSARSDLRPEIFSMLFLSIFMVVLYSFRKTPSYYIFFLVPLEILWVNMHIYFFVGPILVALFAIDSLIASKFKFSRSVKILAITFIALLSATLINPNGLRGAIFPITVLGDYGLPIMENQSIFTLSQYFTNFAIIAFAFSAIFLFVLFFLERRYVKPIDWFLLIIFSLTSFLIYRNILLFVFTTFIAFALTLNHFLKDIQLFFKKLLPKTHLKFISSLLLASLILILITTIATHISAYGFGFGVTDFGKGVGDLLVKNNIKGPIFNSFDIGGYLWSRVYPNLVYIDGRPEAYPRTFFEDIYIHIRNNPKIFEIENKKYRFNVLVLSHWDQTPWPDPFLKYLLNHRSYSLVYVDSYSVVFLKETDENKNFIAKYRILKDDIDLSHVNKSDQLIHYLFFFEKAKWTDKAKDAFSRLAMIDPQLCELRKYLNRIRDIKVSFINTKELEGACKFLML